MFVKSLGLINMAVYFQLASDIKGGLKPDTFQKNECSMPIFFNCAVLKQHSHRPAELEEEFKLLKIPCLGGPILLFSSLTNSRDTNIFIELSSPFSKSLPFPLHGF